MSLLIGFHIWDYLPSRRNMIFPKKTRSCHISTGLLNPKDILSRLIEAVWVYFVIWWITFRAQVYCLPIFNLQTLTVKNVITMGVIDALLQGLYPYYVASSDMRLIDNGWKTICGKHFPPLGCTRWSNFRHIFIGMMWKLSWLNLREIRRFRA